MVLWRMLTPLPRNISKFHYFHCNYAYEGFSVQQKCNILTKSSTSLPILKFGLVFGSSLVKKQFHTSACKSALPPIVLLLFRPIAKSIAIVFGRTIRVWWKSLPQSRKDSLVMAIKNNKFIFIGFLAPVTAGTGYFVYTHIEEDPITKRQKFVLYSQQQMMQLAEIEQAAVIEEYKEFVLPPAHPVYKRVLQVTNRLLQSNIDLKAIHERNWTVFVIDKPTIKNAFVLPNGSIFIFSGMLAVCSNDDQLGNIIAHEVSHCLLSHMAELLSSHHLAELFLFIPVLIIWAVLPDLGAVFAQWASTVFANTLFHLPFSRSSETEADEIGLQLAAKACFDVREASAFWAKMRILACDDDSDEDSFEWLSTHPSHETRQCVLDALIPSAIQVREDCKCPKLPSQDPRAIMASLLIAVEDEHRKKEQNSVSNGQITHQQTLIK